MLWRSGSQASIPRPGSIAKPLRSLAASWKGERIWLKSPHAPSAPDGWPAPHRSLVELETKLHLAAEEVEVSLDGARSRALRHIPSAAQDAVSLRSELASLAATITALRKQLEGERAAAAANVAVLREADVVKGRMEAACKTLQEATELSALFARMEDVFAAEDLPRAAATLATMRRSLALVAGVPEFSSGPVQVNETEGEVEGGRQEGTTRQTASLSMQVSALFGSSTCERDS